MGQHGAGSHESSDHPSSSSRFAPGSLSLGPAALYETCIVWFRRDLRLYDHPTLAAALRTSRAVLPRFIWSPEEEGQFQPGAPLRWWTKTSVKQQLSAVSRHGFPLHGQARPAAGAKARRPTALLPPSSEPNNRRLMGVAAGCGWQAGP
jgi:hypothetical protein